MESSLVTRRTTLWMGLLVASVVATGATLFLIWLFVGGGPWHGGVNVAQATPHPNGSVTLYVGACRRAPSVYIVEETDDYVRVKAEAYSTLLGSELHCLERVEIHLKAPLGNRPLIDGYTGQTVRIFIPGRTK